MSKVQPNRPGARPSAAGRPGATPTTPGQATTRRNGPSEEELQKMRALPATEDTGVVADIDPDNASAGRVTNEMVTISGAKYFIQDWKRKDGSIPEGSVPEVHLRLLLRREGDEEGDKPYTQDYRYGSPLVFVPSTDGNQLNIRKSAVKDGVPPPVAQKKNPAVRLLKSIKDAGGANIIERMKKEGVKALTGLRVQLRSQKTPDMSEKAYPILLVDFIDGVTKPTDPAPQTQAASPAPASPASSAAPAAQAPAAASSEIDTLATEALLAVIEKAGGSVVRASIPTTLIQIDKWKAHAQRGDILKRIREDAFLGSQDGVLWVLDGNNVKSL